jgi:RNA polymerase sigma factor (sigma-70 family)
MILSKGASGRESSHLVERCLKGDASAWNLLVERYGRLVYAIPLRYGMSDADANDVFQEVFTLLHQRMASIRDRSRLSAWLITTTHRECWRVVRSRDRTCGLHDRWADPREPAPALAERWEEQQILREAIERLGPRDRACIQALFIGAAG